MPHPSFHPPHRPALRHRRSYTFLPPPPTDPFGMRPFDPALFVSQDRLFAPCRRRRAIRNAGAEGEGVWRACVAAVAKAMKKTRGIGESGLGKGIEERIAVGITPAMEVDVRWVGVGKRVEKGTENK
ncbi:hypothetical protein SVAN01_01215 [Stagonosporopsis vannaccii]|nr:hypothetical protein SVAN01_01215 [Stagonosporopsis vannaccii]